MGVPLVLKRISYQRNVRKPVRTSSPPGPSGRFKTDAHKRTSLWQEGSRGRVFLRLPLLREQFQRLDAGLGERRGAQLQQKVGGALPDDARALIVIVLDAGGGDGGGGGQKRFSRIGQSGPFFPLFKQKIN